LIEQPTGAEVVVLEVKDGGIPGIDVVAVVVVVVVV